MKRVTELANLAAAVGLAIGTPATAQTSGQTSGIVQIPTPAQSDAIPLYAGTGSLDSEVWVKFYGTEAVRNVTRPTITPYLPATGKANGAAVVIAPGGAFMMLAIELEGANAARWLADHGVAAFVLKYRVKPTPRNERAAGEYMGQQMAEATAAISRGQPLTLSEPKATEDALAAIRMVRANAANWGVDPDRVGMMGFSAGAITTLNAALADNAVQRPAFIGYVYGPMGPVNVPADAPPMFSAIALDDELFKGTGFGIVESWRKAGRPVELHGYEKGMHGFGTGRPGTTTTLLMPEFLAWMEARGLLKASGK